MNYICHSRWLAPADKTDLKKLFAHDNLSAYARRDRVIVALTMCGFTPEHIKTARRQSITMQGSRLYFKGVKLPLSVSRLVIEYKAERDCRQASPGSESVFLLSSVGEEFTRTGIFMRLRKYGFMPERETE